jgi:protein-S-isoprenylcysteine O-methyltransferase Ste14
VWPDGAAIGLLIAYGACCILRVRADYRQEVALRISAVAALSLLYSAHFAIVVLAAAASRWHLSIDRGIGIGLGVPLLTVGSVLYVGAVASFRSLPRMCGLDTNRLVTTGVYRWSRNPQNLGWTLVLVGIAFISRSGLVFLLAALFWLAFLLYLPTEEQFLERIFGDQYRQYRSWSHRYFGAPRKIRRGATTAADRRVSIPSSDNIEA